MFQKKEELTMFLKAIKSFKRWKTKGDLQYTREIQEIYNTRDIQEILKEKSKSVQKGIQEHSKRGFFKPTFQP